MFFYFNFLPIYVCILAFAFLYHSAFRSHAAFYIGLSFAAILDNSENWFSFIFRTQIHLNWEMLLKFFFCFCVVKMARRLRMPQELKLCQLNTKKNIRSAKYSRKTLRNHSAFRKNGGGCVKLGKVPWHVSLWIF